MGATLSVVTPSSTSALSLEITPNSVSIVESTLRPVTNIVELLRPERPVVSPPAQELPVQNTPSNRSTSPSNEPVSQVTPPPAAVQQSAPQQIQSSSSSAVLNQSQSTVQPTTVAFDPQASNAGQQSSQLTAAQTANRSANNMEYTSNIITANDARDYYSAALVAVALGALLYAATHISRPSTPVFKRVVSHSN